MDDAIMSYLEAHQSDMLRDLQRLVESESPSTNKESLDRTAIMVRELLAQSGFDTAIISQTHAGNHVRGIVPGDAPGKPLLLLAHYDTVWAKGTLKTMPFSVEGGVIRGPGVFDMKTGLIQAIWAVRALRETHNVHRPIIFFSNSDEEIGSLYSRPLIERDARQAHAALVFEASHHGALKTSRKGTALYEMEVTGKAAHAGLDPSQGVSAIEELADQILRLRRLANPAAGTTINVGVVKGGSRSNVIAATACASIDIRIATVAEAERVATAMESLTPVRKGAHVRVVGGINRPPMERTEAIANLFFKARAIGKRLGLDLDEAAVGGASDGNFCAALGVPVIDGLGAVGDGAHASHEFVEAGTIPVRTALAAHLMVAL